MDKLNIYTFLSYWYLYHNKNPQPMENKTASKNIWYNCHDLGRKRKVIKEISKSNLSAYEYLKLKI